VAGDVVAATVGAAATVADELGGGCVTTAVDELGGGCATTGADVLGGGCVTTAPDEPGDDSATTVPGEPDGGSATTVPGWPGGGSVTTVPGEPGDGRVTTVPDVPGEGSVTVLPAAAGDGPVLEADGVLEVASTLATRTPPPSAAPASSVMTGIVGFMTGSTPSGGCGVHSHPRNLSRYPEGGSSGRTLIRRFHDALGMSPQQWLRGHGLSGELAPSLQRTTWHLPARLPPDIRAARAHDAVTGAGRHRHVPEKE
jgi:hypothetical protein